ncbi:AfsR/SARP family transcriptional regulator [Streptomyces marianii]|uniref:AfsR/SARP family transcriptional regulator n=1 Tax=Streptomyces marianii TaxID=1817406 RepID=A0A5R9DXY8_9ACTN|nr:BTAD domain-containing putative transcriptional regulator [Streptomyces marianii]TLQ42470.1 AfsR/SARP family transcriptional regulator [Streptomyces marianii]
MNEATPPGASSAAAAPAALRIGILGPLEVRTEGRDRTPTAPMARRALAALLLNANRLVSTSALIEELWEGEPPRLARKTVQTYVYQMRQALRPGDSADTRRTNRLETGSGGYRLVLRPGELDLWEFEHRVARARIALSEGDAVEGARLLREGLGLWRGEPFAGLEAGPLLAAQIAHLADSRLGALELRIDAELQLGRHRALVGELRKLTADHPLNERFTAQLMTAAYRAGQRGAALDAFTRLRRSLVDELGIEPSERLQELQRTVLGAEAPVEAVPTRSAAPSRRAGTAPAVASQLPLPTADFVGRESELDFITECLDEPGPRVLTVLGPAGVGKSALAVHAAHLLRDRFPDGQLHARLHDGADEPREPGSVLRALLKSAGAAGELDPQGPVDELAAVFRDWSSERSLLLLLEDAAGTDQVLPLLPGGTRSLVLVTSRIRLPGLTGARGLSLAPLTTDDAAALFTRVAGASRVGGDTEALREVVQLMGNFPLSLRAVGEKFAVRPMWTLPDLALGLRDENQLAAELRDDACNALARATGAIARLAPPLRRALHLLAAAAPDPFDIARAGELLDCDTWSAQSVVGRLLDRHVVIATEQEEAATAAAMTFRVHDLIRMATAREETSDARVLPLAGRSGSGRFTATG